MLTMPIEVCEYTPALSSAGDIVLCDFSQYLLAEREPGVDSSIHVQFVTDETAFRFRFRADGQPAGVAGDAEEFFGDAVAVHRARSAL
jgi:HK97 family phage major capsid protein